MGQEGGIQARPVGRVLRLLTEIGLVVEGGRHLIGAGSSLMLLTAGVVAGEFVFYASPGGLLRLCGMRPRRAGRPSKGWCPRDGHPWNWQRARHARAAVPSRPLEYRGAGPGRLVARS